MFLGEDAWRQAPPPERGPRPPAADVPDPHHRVFRAAQWYVRGVHLSRIIDAGHHLRRRGQSADAEALWLECCARMEETHEGPTYPVYEALAIHYERAHRLPDALAICERYLALGRPWPGPPPDPITRRLERLLARWITSGQR